MTKTKIEWCDEVWNPVTGCTKVSQGCKHCYAEMIANRFWAKQYPPNEDGSPRKFTDVRLHPERLDEPLKWKKPRRVFVNSMSDLFHEDVPDDFILQAWDVMSRCRQHTYIILTKRPERMQQFVSWLIDDEPTTIRENIWLGVSVEDQKTADERIPILLQTPAAVRFVSYEPALGLVDFTTINGALNTWSKNGEIDVVDEGKLDWIIMGGESGPGARPMHPDWARSTRDQCQAAGVPFFFKQWGEWVTAMVEDDPKFVGGRAFNNPAGGRSAAIITSKSPGPFQQRPVRLLEPGDETQGGIKMLDSDTVAIRIGKKAAGRKLDGRTWDEYPGGE